MRQLTVFILFVLSFSLAQSLTGNYVFTDPDSGQSITLGLEQAQNNTFVGQLGFLGTSLELTGQVTGPGTGTGEFTPVNDEMTALGKVLIALQGDQLSLTFEDTGDELTLTREGATPLPADNSGDGEDTIITDGEDTIITGDEDTIITDEGDTVMDEDEVAYCQDFLSDAESVTDDPEEEAYCKEVISASETQTPLSSDTTTGTTTPNPLNPGTAQNPLTATADAFSGVYRGENIALTVQLANGQYTGTLEFNGQTYPVQGVTQENKLVGTFQANGSPFEFAFYAQDTFFTLESGGQNYNLMKQP